MKKKKTRKKQYLGKEVQECIVKYQNSSCQKEKEKLYTETISVAFTELAKSLISVYGFKATNEDLNHLKHDCITFLFETIHKWNPENGTKAFSYFNVVAKNWLTIHSKRLLKNHRRSVYIDNPESLSKTDKSDIYDREYVDSDLMIEKFN